jgi:hypothetical protein
MKLLTRTARWSAVAAALGLALPGAASAAATLVTMADAVRAPGGQIVFTCSAVATEPSSAVFISQCYTTTGSSAPSLTLPGQAAAVAGVDNKGSRGPFSVCVEAKARLVAGAREVVAPLRCVPPTLDLESSQGGAT